MDEVQGCPTNLNTCILVCPGTLNSALTFSHCGKNLNQIFGGECNISLLILLHRARLEHALIN